MKIENERLLTERFGKWPSFHDAEIVRACFERGDSGAALLDCDFYVFEMTKEIDEKGFFVLAKKSLATIRFFDIVLEYFDGWNCQNVLSGLIISDTEAVDPDPFSYRPIEVVFHSSYGCGAKFYCRTITVIKVLDYNQN